MSDTSPERMAALRNRARDLEIENERLKEVALRHIREQSIESSQLFAKVAELEKENKYLRTTRFAKFMPALTNHTGALCGLCDGTHWHKHERVECSRCGKQGLRENWPFRCCIVEQEAGK